MAVPGRIPVPLAAVLKVVDQSNPAFDGCRYVVEFTTNEYSQLLYAMPQGRIERVTVFAARDKMTAQAVLATLVRTLAEK